MIRCFSARSSGGHPISNSWASKTSRTDRRRSCLRFFPWEPWTKRSRPRHEVQCRDHRISICCTTTSSYPLYLSYASRRVISRSLAQLEPWSCFDRSTQDARIAAYSTSEYHVLSNSCCESWLLGINSQTTMLSASCSANLTRFDTILKERWVLLCVKDVGCSDSWFERTDAIFVSQRIESSKKDEDELTDVLVPRLPISQ